MQLRSLILALLMTVTIFGSAGYLLTRSLASFTPLAPESQLSLYNRAASPSPSVASPNLDLDQDGTLTLSDYQLLLSLVGTNNPQADFNASGRVDIMDYHTLALGFIK